MYFLFSVDASRDDAGVCSTMRRLTGLAIWLPVLCWSKLTKHTMNEPNEPNEMFTWSCSERNETEYEA